MSIAIDFERTLLQLLEQHSALKNDKQCEHRILKTNATHICDYNNENSIIPSATSLFLGICIGVGLSSYSLLTNWK